MRRNKGLSYTFKWLESCTWTLRSWRRYAELKDTYREKLQEQVSATISVSFDPFDMFTQANKY